MNILHVISSLDRRRGGPPAALLGLAKAQKQMGADVTVLATWQRGEDLSICKEFAQHHIPTELVGPALGPLVWHWNLKQTTPRLVAQADIVHIHALWEEIQHHAARAARKLGKPYIIRPCGMLDPWSLAHHPWRKRLYLAWRLSAELKHAAAVHFTSGAECQGARPLRLRAKTIIEPNGVDWSEFEQLPPPGKFRARFPEISSRPMVLFLGRIHPKKGLELLIPAFARTKIPGAMLVIAGPDANGYQRKLETLVRDNHIEDRVLFTGMLQGPERFEALVDADLFVLPSYQENFGVAVVEALATGTPVLISDQVNICEEIRAGGVGSVVPVREQPIAEELTRWLTDASLRAAASQRARPFARSHYDWAGIAPRWQVHYEKMSTKPR